MWINDRIKRLAESYAKDNKITDPIELECIEALYAYEAVLTEKAGKPRYASRTWPMFRRHGIIEAVELVVDRPTDAIGYTSLVEMGLQEYAFEAIILRHPTKFSPRSVARSQQRLDALKTTSQLGSGWTDEELTDSIRAYLDMQVKQRNGEDFTKTSYYRQLAEQYGRSEGAYEYRMQNISYVLSLLGRGWLSGLKPAKNVGSKVAAKIEKLIAEIEGNKSTASASFEIDVYEAVQKPPSSPPLGKQVPGCKVTPLIQYERDFRVKAWVLLRANGRCECCSGHAPFTRPNGMPYLEVHHVQHMADGGPDTITNTVALCPNCHRELHHGGNAQELIDRLYSNVSELEKPEH